MREDDKWGEGVCWLNWPGFKCGSLHRNHVGVFEFEEKGREKEGKTCDGQNNEQNTKC